MPSSSASQWAEIKAVFLKEVRTEFRSQAGLMTAGLFGLVAVVAIAMAGFGMVIGGTLAAGLLWVALMFAAAIAMPRTFLIEEELGTGDLLRLWGRPHSIYWGKVLFNCALMSVQGVLLSALYLLFTERKAALPGLFFVNVFLGSVALASAVTLCGALAGRAANRSALAAAIGVPLVLPLASLGVSAMRTTLEASTSSGTMYTVALAGYVATLLALGPYLYAAVWKT